MRETAILQEILNRLIFEHDAHMKLTYEQFISGAEVTEMWAYGAGLFHAIRTLQDAL